LLIPCFLMAASCLCLFYNIRSKNKCTIKDKDCQFSPRRFRAQRHCIKWRARKEIKNPEGLVMKNKGPATRGVCPTCGTNVFRIGK